jgi:hypothetical protein
MQRISKEYPDRRLGFFSIPSEASGYTTKELSLETWPDLEKLFTKPGIGSASGCWCTFHHTASFTAKNTPRTKAEAAVRHRREKKELVKKGESHGIIVYGKDADPIGWCQYGPKEELPRMDHNRIYLDKVGSDDQKVVLENNLFCS